MDPGSVTAARPPSGAKFPQHRTADFGFGDNRGVVVLAAILAAPQNSALGEPVENRRDRSRSQLLLETVTNRMHGCLTVRPNQPHDGELQTAELLFDMTISLQE